MEGKAMEQYILNEMYFGKLPSLVKLEDYISKLRQKYKGMNLVDNLSNYRKLIKDPILMKMAYEIMEAFGFKEATVTIVRDPSFNAYTVPFFFDSHGNSYTIDDHKVPLDKFKSTVIVTNSGFRFDKKKFPVNIVVAINIGALFKDTIHNLEFTPAELIAVILHEIGHNFSAVVGAKQTPTFSKADETFADSFAAMYGYGPEFTSAFAKLGIRYSNFDKKLKDVPVLNIIIGLKNIANGLLVYNKYDEHPEVKTRIDNVLRQMETDLKETPNLTPGMREDLKKQIDICKQISHDIYEPTDEDRMGIRMTKYYYREMQPGYEEDIRQETDKYVHPTKLNQKIGGMMKPKGFFKFQ